MKTKKLILYEEEPYFSNALNSMAKKNWVLVSKKRLQEEFSFKTIVECTFSKKNISHWKAEYEIIYSINSVSNGKIVNENSIWIVEACSLNEARSIATKHFANVSGFNIRNIKKYYDYPSSCRFATARQCRAARGTGSDGAAASRQQA